MRSGDGWGRPGPGSREAGSLPGTIDVVGGDGQTPGMDRTWIDRLIAAIGWTAAPRHSFDWAATEEQLGVRLPADYKESAPSGSGPTLVAALGQEDPLPGQLALRQRIQILVNGLVADGAPVGRCGAGHGCKAGPVGFQTQPAGDLPAARSATTRDAGTGSAGPSAPSAGTCACGRGPRPNRPGSRESWWSSAGSPGRSPTGAGPDAGLSAPATTQPSTPSRSPSDHHWSKASDSTPTPRRSSDIATTV